MLRVLCDKLQDFSTESTALRATEMNLEAEIESLRAQLAVARATITRAKEINVTITNLWNQDVQHLAARVPDGWKLVPVEPTEEMCRVDFECDDSIGIDSARICYKAMLSAAPSQQASVQGGPVGHVVWAANVPNTVKEVQWTDFLAPPVGTKLYTHPQQAREPMTEEQGIELAKSLGWKVDFGGICKDALELIRVVELHHKIGEKQ
jgi:hypothetical protein